MHFVYEDAYQKSEMHYVSLNHKALTDGCRKLKKNIN